MAEDGQVICCHTIKQWKDQFQKGLESKKLDVADEYKVEVMPTFIFLKDGKEVDKIVGGTSVDHY